MKRFATLFYLLVALFGAAPRSIAAGRYAVEKRLIEGHTTYHLMDSSRKMDFGVVPDIGNLAYEFKDNGKDVLIPVTSFKSFLEKHWFCCGIPILAPWADRIDEMGYYFQGKKYLLNDGMGNLLHVPPDNLPLHGVLVFDSRWQVIKSGASDADGAFITSRMDFYKYPDLMEQFPFAHIMDVTYRLKDGKLENVTEIHADTAMPVAFGYHPYLKPDGPREGWSVSINARTHWIVDNHQRLIPTGETEPAQNYIPRVNQFTLGKRFIDDGFSDLDRDSQGHGHFWVKGEHEKIELVFGKDYPVGHVYAPPDNTLICMEPETAVTNAFNLNHAGKYPQLIVAEPGKVFRATFWIVPTGF